MIKKSKIYQRLQNKKAELAELEEIVDSRTAQGEWLGLVMQAFANAREGVRICEAMVAAHDRQEAEM